MRALAVWALLGTACASQRDEVRVVPAPPPPAPATWTDPVSGERWLVGNTKVTWARTKDTCTATWRRPTVADLELAWERGLTHTATVLWSVSVTDTQALAYDLTTGEASVHPKTDAAAVSACVTEK